MTSTATSVIADGKSKVTFSVVLRDAQNKVVPNTTVTWGTTGGTLANRTSVTDGNGVASMELTSPTTLGVANVVAFVGGISSGLKVDFVPGPAAVITGVSGGSGQTAPNRAVVLQAQVQDINGNPVAAGVKVNWSTTIGSLSSASTVTDSNGLATVVMTAPNLLTEGRITATLANNTTVSSSSYYETFADVSLRAVGSWNVLTGVPREYEVTVLAGLTGVPVPGAKVFITATPGALNVPASVVTDSNGKARFFVSTSYRADQTAGVYDLFLNVSMGGELAGPQRAAVSINMP